MKLYNLSLSGNCYKVRLFAALAGIDVDIVDVDFLGGEHKRPPLIDLNPWGEIPVLVDGDVVLRDSQAILDFDRAYIRAFGALPSLYSYRGYDAALIFCPAMYNDIEYDMEGRSYTPLQTTYVFGQGEQRDNHVNRNWTRVNYNSDFTITIE